MHISAEINTHTEQWSLLNMFMDISLIQTFKLLRSEVLLNPVNPPDLRPRSWFQHQTPSRALTSDLSLLHVVALWKIDWRLHYPEAGLRWEAVFVPVGGCRIKRVISAFLKKISRSCHFICIQHLKVGTSGKKCYFNDWDVIYPIS